MEGLDKNEIKQNIFRILKGSITAIILTVILLFIFSLILTYTNLQENIMPPVVIVITSISILVGSSISTLKIKKNGLINGAFVGIIYIITIYIISSLIISTFILNINSIIMLISSIIAGMIGRYYRSQPRTLGTPLFVPNWNARDTPII